MTRPAISLAAPRRRRAVWVPPLMVGAAVSLLAGLWSGLARLGLSLPTSDVAQPSTHGALMTLGFLGTLIALERAVALGAAWAYAAPAAAGAGGLAVTIGAPDGIGQLLLVVGGVTLVANFVAVHRIQASLHNVVLTAGAVCWVVAAVLWLVGWEIPRLVPWLAGFLVLTIAGERLELSRLVGASRTARQLFVTAVGVFAVGLVGSLIVEPIGVRVAGVGLLGIAAWLARFDVARRTIHARGLTRYMAVALLLGYGWLAVGGLLWTINGNPDGGPAYDAMLHAVFLGFVMSMVFAHAPVIVPAVLGRPMPYRRILYVPLALLHASLALRLIGGDAAGSLVARQWGGTLNEVAILMFVFLAGAAMIRARGQSRSPIEPVTPSASARTSS